MKRLGLLGLALALVGCGGKGREVEADGYEPDATEVPLSADFDRAAKRRVRPDTYKRELDRIERELKLERRTE